MIAEIFRGSRRDIKYISELNGTMRGNLSWFDIANHVTFRLMPYFLVLASG
jgi:hypothetical protein